MFGHPPGVPVLSARSSVDEADSHPSAVIRKHGDLVEELLDDVECGTDYQKATQANDSIIE